MTLLRWMLAVVVLAGCQDGPSTDPGVPPIAHDDDVTVGEDSATLLDTDVIANDENVTFVSVGDPAHGRWVLTVKDSHALRIYEPDPGYHGPDQFTYEAHGATATTSTATVHITVADDGVPYEQSVQVDDSNAAALAVGDLDGDGKQDLVTCDPRSSSIVVLINRTTAPGAYAAAPFRFEGGREPIGVTTADLDGDGRLDVITAARTDGLVILRNVTATGGTPSFEAPVYLPSGDAAAVVAFDVNGDGTLDLAALDTAGRAIQVRLGSSTPGALAFGDAFSFATGAGPVQMFAADADADGTPDLAVLARAAGELSIFVNATAVGATVPAFASRLDRGTGALPSSMFLADLDGDGHDEIGVLHPEDGLWIYANRTATPGQPSFQAARVIDLPFTVGPVIAAVDLDAQGGQDLVVAAPDDVPYTMLFNQTLQVAAYAFESRDGELGDATAHTRVRQARPTAVQLADLDGVAPPELVVTTTYDSGTTGSTGTFVLFGR